MRWREVLDAKQGMATNFVFRMELLSVSFLLLAVLETALTLSAASGTTTSPTPTLKIIGKDTVRVGEPVFLHCNVSGRSRPRIRWKLHNYFFTNATRFFPNGTMYIARAERAVSGVWNCELADGSASSGLFVLDVWAPPRITHIIAPKTNVSKGTVFVVQCRGHGSLPTFWKWYKDGKQIMRMANGLRIRTDTEKISIALNRSAEIKCMLKNRHGEAQKKVTIDVFSGAVIPTVPTKVTPVVTTTSRPPLPCVTYGGGVCSPWLLAGHRWAYDPKVQSASKLSGREKAVRQILTALDKAKLSKDTELGQQCARGMKALVCGFSYPVCPNPGEVRRERRRPGPLCREHCEAVHLLFCAGIPLSKIWQALRDVDVPSELLREFLPDRDSPMCKGLPHAVTPRATGTRGVADKNSQPHCTRVDFEPEWRQPDEETLRAKNRCFVKRGQLYNGTMDKARLSINSKTELKCARWNDSRVASALLRKGYSVVAFPSLKKAGRACRNPAGLRVRPFCVPENPTKRHQTPIVTCNNLLSCVEFHENQQRGEKVNEVYILGYPVAKRRLILSVAILIIVFVLLVFIIAYCVFCQCQSGMKRPSDREDVVAANASEYGFGSSIGASIASEFDGSAEMKSLLLTQNHDYHGKALAEFLSPKLLKLEYPRAEIRDIAELGRGAFGEVFLVEAPKLGYDEYQKPVRAAMKVLKNDAPPEMQIQFLKEAKLLAELNNNNIIKLVGISLCYKPFCMLLEYMCHGDLNSFLRKYGPDHAMRVNLDPLTAAANQPSMLRNGHVMGNGSGIYIQMTPQPSMKLNRVTLCQMAVNIADGMIYLSHLNYVHRDLASRNCLLDANWNVKIGDFALCRHIRRGEDFIDDDHGPMPIRWMPLESILERRFNLDTDVWSFGVLLWELFSFALQPYYGKTHDEVIEFLQKGSCLDKPPAAPDNVYRLMLRCWSRQRRERPTFAWLKRQLSELQRRWKESESDRL